MGNCNYCTNYHLNSHERLDNACMGINDCRKEHFTCNENLKPKPKKIEKKNQSDTCMWVYDDVNENGLYIPECTKDEDDAFDWLALRHFKFCPYCGKKFNVVEYRG